MSDRTRKGAREERSLLISQGRKRCGECGIIKSLVEFGKKKNGAGGVQGRCNSCLTKARLEYNIRNRSIINERNRDWRKSNPEKYKQSLYGWRDKNPEKLRAISNRRRARRASAAGHCTAAQIDARFEYHGNRCIYCGCGGKMTIEHLIPLSRGGTNWPANIAPSCLSCNATKHDRTHAEFTDLIK